jgi:histidinol phosphatase-like enzyme
MEKHQDKKTYFFDIDGTIVKNMSFEDLEVAVNEPGFIQELLPGVDYFFKWIIDKDDIVIFTTARSEKYREMTLRTLENHKIKYKTLLMDLCSGPRILVNDTVNVFYKKAIAINVARDQGFGDTFIYDPLH